MEKYEFSEQLLTLRSVAGLTQEEFAEKLGVTKRSVSSWENGTITPKKSLRIKLAVLFDCPPDYFVFEDEKTQNVGNVNILKDSEEEKLLQRLRSVIQNSNTREKTKEKYMNILFYNTISKENK